jgi:hypothetical protein
MAKHNALGGGSFGWHWTNRYTGEERGSIGFSVSADAMRLSFSIDGQPVLQQVALDRTRCHFGGTRTWFRCPAMSSARARSRVSEVHPQVCFWAMNRGTPLGDGKTTRAGVDARLKLLSHRLPQASGLLTRVLAERRRAQVKADDVLDALAAYLVAAADPAAVLRLRGEPSDDPQSLPMEMLYIE